MVVEKNWHAEEADELGAQMVGHRSKTNTDPGLLVQEQALMEKMILERMQVGVRVLDGENARDSKVEVAHKSEAPAAVEDNENRTWEEEEDPLAEHTSPQGIVSVKVRV